MATRYKCSWKDKWEIFGELKYLVSGGKEIRKMLQLLGEGKQLDSGGCVELRHKRQMKENI